MTRVTKPADNSQVLVRTVVGPLIDDYVSQTATPDQALASNLSFASGKRPIFKGGALPFVTVGSDAGCDYDETEIQDAVDASPNSQVQVISPITLNDTLLLPSYTYLKLLKPLTLANGVNADMIRNEHYGASFDIGITIEGLGGGYDETVGSLQGNSANNTTSSLIAMDKVNYCSIRHLDLSDAKITGLSIANATMAKIDNLRIRTAATGINIDTVVDSWFNRINSYNITGKNWASHALSASHISNLYLGGAAEAVEGQFYSWVDSLNLFNNVKIDNSAVESMYLTNSYQNQFDTTIITGGASTPDNTKSAIRLTGNTALGNVFCNTQIPGYIDNHKWLLGVEEIDGADKNFYNGLITQTAHVSTATSLGANSKLNANYSY